MIGKFTVIRITNFEALVNILMQKNYNIILFYTLYNIV